MEPINVEESLRIIHLYKRLKSECINELLENPNRNANIMIATIRKYNREWNKEVVNGVAPDGFIKLMKQNMLNIFKDEKEICRALCYL